MNILEAILTSLIGFVLIHFITAPINFIAGFSLWALDQKEMPKKKKK